MNDLAVDLVDAFHRRIELQNRYGAVGVYEFTGTARLYDCEQYMVAGMYDGPLNEEEIVFYALHTYTADQALLVASFLRWYGISSDPETCRAWIPWERGGHGTDRVFHWSEWVCISIQALKNQLLGPIEKLQAIIPLNLEEVPYGF